MRIPSINATGRRAYAAGLKASDNPFRVGSYARTLWARGYREAKDKALGRHPLTCACAACIAEADAILTRGRS